MFVLPYSSLLPISRSVYSFHDIWSVISFSFNWFFIYPFIAFSFPSTVFTKRPIHQKFLLSYLYFKLVYLSNIVNTPLLLRNLINCATFRYGGILASIWIWSRHAYTSMRSTFFFTQIFNDLHYIRSSFFVCYFLFIFYPKHYMILLSIFKYFLFHFPYKKTPNLF